MMLTSEIDLTTIYEDEDGSALDIFGCHYLDEEGYPLGLHELEELLNSPPADVQATPSDISTIRESTRNQGMFEGFNERIGDYDQMADADEVITLLGLSDCSMQSLYRNSRHQKHRCTPFPRHIEFQSKRYWFSKDILEWGLTNILFIMRLRKSCGEKMTSEELTPIFTDCYLELLEEPKGSTLVN
jgi:hypothetical protein